jgi:proteic killer suppression protein
MIVSFACRETEKIFHDFASRKFPSDMLRIARRKLLMLHAAQQVKDLRIPPGNRLEALKGNRKGQFSIRINDQWRVCFQFKNAQAFNVEIVDYHG